MASNSILGLTFVADVAGFSRGVNKVMRSFSTVEYLADKMGNKVKGEKGIFGQRAMHAVGLAAGIGLMGGMSLAIGGAGILNMFTKPMIAAANKAEVAMANAMFLADADAGSALEKRISDTVRKVATSSTISISEGYDTIGAIIQSGIDANIAPDLLASVVEYSEASFGKTSVAQSVSMLTTGLQKFNVEGATAEEKMRNLGDILTATKKYTAFDDKSIKSFFQAIGAAPKRSQNTSIQEFMVLGGMLKGTGKTAKRVGNNINSLVQGTLKFQTALADIAHINKGKDILNVSEGMQLNFDDFIDEKGGMKSMIDIIGLISDGAIKAAKLHGGKDQKVMAQIYSKIFQGKEVGPEIQELFNNLVVLEAEGQLKGLEAFKKKLKQVEGASGVMNKAAIKNRETWEGLAKIIKGIKESIDTIIGQEMKKMLGKSLTKLKEVLEAISTELVNNDSLRKNIAMFLLLAPPIMVIVGSMISLLGLLLLALPYLIASAEVIGAIATGIGLAFLPLLAAVLAIAMVVGVLGYLLMNNVGGSADWLKKKFILIKETIGGIIEFWKGWGDTKIANKLRKLGIWELVKSVYMLKERLLSVWKGFKSAFDKSKAGEVFEKLAKVIQKVVDTIFGGNGKFARSDMDEWEKFGQTLFDIFTIVGVAIAFFLAMLSLAIAGFGMMLVALSAVANYILRSNTALLFFKGALIIIAIYLAFVITFLTVVMFILAAMLLLISAIGLVLAGIFLAPFLMLIAIGIFIYLFFTEVTLKIVDVVAEGAKSLYEMIMNIPKVFKQMWEGNKKSFVMMIKSMGFKTEGGMTPADSVNDEYADVAGGTKQNTTEENVNKSKNVKVGDITINVQGDASSPEGLSSLGGGILSGIADYFEKKAIQDYRTG